MKKLTIEYIEDKILENVDFPRKKKHWLVLKENFGKKTEGLKDKSKEVKKNGKH
ncbi:MAG: hypothetical protein ACTSQ8_07880 [Candidatus Helarchaeota archaeon]